MTVFNEGRDAGEFLLSEANGNRSRDVVTVASGSGVIAPGTILGKLTSGGKYQPSPATGTDGSQTAVAVALYGCDATSADQKLVVVARDAEVNVNLLSYASTVDDATKKAAKATQLAAVGIIVR